jgi:hypothetical protein
VIDCSGRTGITLAFNYMEAGDGINDNALLYYFDGTSWTLLTDLPKTLCCGGVPCNGSLQGIWTAYSIALPASANNNANVRIGFRWMNNADGIATDPSFAVDDITLSSAGAVESFTAEYFKANPQVMFSNVVNPNIDHISQCEYWTLTQDAGTSARTVTLTWDGNSCGVTLLPDLVVARYNGASWDDRGNGGTTGNTTAGTVTSAAPQTAYGPFTLASVSFQNPLPVELISLEADYVDASVEVKWITASEINSDFFTILRSSDGHKWESLGSIKAAGFSSGVNYYRFEDQDPLPALSYYRLNQVDRDGSNELTGMVAVHAPYATGEINIVHLFSNPADDMATAFVYSTNACSVKLEICDINGKKILEKNVSLSPGINAIENHIGDVPRGIYFIRLLTDQSVIPKRFFY